MTTRKLGRALMIIGVFAILASLVIDYVGLGDQRVGSSQLLGIMSGVIVTLVGFSLAFHSAEAKIDLLQSMRVEFSKIFNLPVSVWVLIGFLIMYLLFFVSPMFLTENMGMRYFNRYLPNMGPVGLDLNVTMDVVTPWVKTGQSPYPQLFNPPLTFILFAPLALIEYPQSYMLITFLTILSYCSLAVLVALLIYPSKDYSLIVLFAGSGLISYGFQFELERGQFNVIAFFLCALAVYIFHRHYNFRSLAYLLFSAAIHIKLYPAIFIVMFVRDWRDWKTNMMRWLGLGLLNFSLLFALGYQEFKAFIDTVMIQILRPSWSWNGNHSLQAFVTNFLRDGYRLIPQQTLAILQQNADLLRAILLVIILGCILAAVVRAFLLNESGFNPYLFSICTLGALIIPTSNDYTLPILAAPLALFFSSLPAINSLRLKVPAILLILTASLAYASILYPFKYKPYYMNNSFMPLLITLIACTILYLLRDKPSAPETTDLVAQTG